MDKENVLKTILEDGVIVIVRTGNKEDALQAVRAVVEGGLKAVEITLNVPGALDAIQEASREHAGRAVIGAGTVLDVAQAQACVKAGALYIVSPALDLDVVRWCRENGVVCAPGCLTPTEIVTAWKAGADLIKVFPASAFGPGYIRELRAPLPQIRLMPTGGVSAENVEEYFQAGAAAVAVGSAVVDQKAVAEGRWADISARARKFMQAVVQASGKT